MMVPRVGTNRNAPLTVDRSRNDLPTIIMSKAVAIA